MKYYLHSVDTMEDEKILELYRLFGYEGTGLFHAILEKIARQEKPIKTETLKYQLKVGKRLEKCWSFMEEIGLISSSNGETFNKQLLNYAECYKIKKEKNAKRILEWRESQIDAKNVTRSEHVRNAPKVNRSKVNRIKEKNIKGNDAEKTASWPQKDFIEIYDRFVKKIIGLPAKIDGAQINAGKQIYAYLKNACKQKQGNDQPEVVLKSWQYIIDHYHQWEPFHQDRTKLTEINSNIQNIAKTLKNGTANRRQPGCTPEQIDAIVEFAFRTQPVPE